MNSSSARFVVFISALISAATSAAFAAPPGSAGRKALFVFQFAGPNRAVDEKVKEHLEAMGLVVSAVDQTDAGAGANQFDLVVISSTVSAHAVADKYRHTTAPLVTWESNILDDLGMSGKKLDTDFGEVERERHLWLVNAPHPLAGGLPAGTRNVHVVNKGMNWGKPGLGATIIATLPGEPGKAAIFAYEKGATMDYENIAPARRVMLFLNNDTFTNLNPDGVKLFDAAIRWALGADKNRSSP
jgi:hypothetical protein